MNLTFKRFQEENAKRSLISYGEGPADTALIFWSNAIAGEAGELCNKVKKLMQGRDVSDEEIAEEIADVVTYASLMASALGVELETIVRDKYNRRSAERNYPRRL